MEPIAKLIEKLKSHSKIVAVILFGSYVKNKTTPISDIDIAVLLKNPIPEDEAELGSLYSDKIDLVLFHKLPIYIQYEVLKHGKEILVKDPKALLEVKFKTLRNYLEMDWLYKRMRSRVMK